MIDYQKTKFYGVNPGYWLNHDELNFERKVKTKTGELSTKEVANYLGLRFIIYYNPEHPERITSMWIHGSLHKYWNFLNGVYAPNQWNERLKERGYNGNRFTYLDFLSVLDDLETRFGVSFDNSTLHHLEYGLNVNHKLSTKLILDGLIFHRGTVFNPEKSNFKYLQRATKVQFQIKAYDKAKQYGELSEKMRLEKKVNKMECIKVLNIKSLHDLRHLNKWELLKNDLLKLWDDILFIDCMMDNNHLSFKERSELKDYTNRNYWSNLDSNRRDEPKKRYKALEKKCKGNTKETFRRCLESAYNELVKVSFDSSIMESNFTPLRIITIHYGLTA
jgi:hypothetical protein